MALAVAVVCGARVARPLPMVVVLIGCAVGLIARRPWLVCLAGLLLASCLGARALAGLDPPPRQAFVGPVTLLSDPEPAGFGTHVEVRAGGRHLEAWARGAAAGALVDRLAGERVLVEGRVGPLPARRPWLTARHVAGRLEIDVISGWEPGRLVGRAANGLRRTLVAGAAVLPDERRILFTGFVLGDDRGQSALVTDDFRGSGLTHLLAVSGQNVAFVLALLGPGLRRLAQRPRLAVTIACLGFFALLTRFEPSVLRATTMATIATLATVLGREASSIRVLALAIAALVVADPLLVGSVGFQMSVAASAGIVVLGPPLARVLPGPEPVRLPLAVTVAAQVGVAPVLLTVFGGMPVVSVVANLLAGPAAGPITAWGLTAGLVAGLLPAPLAGVVHLPTGLLVGWVALVARSAVAMPLGQLGVASFAGAVVAGSVLWFARRSGRRVVALLAAGAMLAVVMSPAVALRSGAPEPMRRIGEGAVLWRSDGRALVVLDGRVGDGALLGGLREAGVQHLDVVVCRSDAVAINQLLGLLRRRYGPALVVAPSDGSMAGARVPASGSTLELGDLVFAFTLSEGSIDVDVTGGGDGASV